MGKIRYFLALTLPALILFSGCKYNDDDLWNEVNNHEERLAALEAWQTRVNTNISSLQQLVSAVENNDHVTGVTKFTTPAPGGYKITFTKSPEATIWNGEKGDKGEQGDTGHSPAIGVKESPAASGIYYWTLDGEFITDNGTPSGNKIPVQGEKGDPGTPGTNGNTPKMMIGTDEYWYFSADGSATGTAPGMGWTPTNVKATGPAGSSGSQGPQGDAIFAENGVDYSNDDYIEFTLANDATKIRVPRYKTIGISFAQPRVFLPSTPQTITYTSTGSVAPTKILVVDLPADWKYAVTYTEGGGEITITAPALITDNNFMGEATVLIGVDSQVAGMYSLTLTTTGPASNDIGAVYYQKGVATGMVYIANDGTPGSGRAVSLQEENQPNLIFSGLDWSSTGAVFETSSTDGLLNMDKIKAATDEMSGYGYTWDDFRAFRWVNNLNGTVGTTTYLSGATNIWYLPSVDELCSDTGKSLYEVFDNYGKTAFNDLLATANGTIFEEEGYSQYWSSTEIDNNFAQAVVFGNGEIKSYNKELFCIVRGILAF